MSRVCAVDGCTKPHYVHGWCRAHSWRWRTYGDPLAGGTPRGECQRYLREVVMAYEGDDCLIWHFSRNANGYGQIQREGRKQAVSRIVCEAAYGAPPTSQHEAAHTCGNGSEGCVAKRHLTWKTPAQNQADRLAHGTHSRGERSASAKLTTETVREILSLKGSATQDVIAERYGVSRATISRIHRGVGWEDALARELEAA